MSRYRKIHVKMWSSADFLSLSAPKPNARDLFVHLLTGPHTTSIPGLFSAGKARLAEEIQWPIRAWERCWDEVERRGMARADWECRLVYLPGALSHNAPVNPNAVHAWRDEWAILPACALRDEAAAAFGSFLASMGATFAAAWRNVVLNVPGQRPGKRSDERSQERSGEHSVEPSRDTRTRARAQATPATVAVAVPALEGVQGEPPDMSDLRRAWNDALLAATAKTWPGIPDSAQFDNERDALSGLWREAEAAGLDYDAFRADLKSLVAEWDKSFPAGRRRDWWHMPTRFLAWDNARQEPEASTGILQSHHGDPTEEELARGGT